MVLTVLSLFCAVAALDDKDLESTRFFTNEKIFRSGGYRGEFHRKNHTEYNSGSFTISVDYREEFFGADPSWLFLGVGSIPGGFEIKMNGRKEYIASERTGPYELKLTHNLENNHVKRTATVVIKILKGRITTYSFNQVDDPNDIYTILRINLE